MERDAYILEVNEGFQAWRTDPQHRRALFMTLPETETPAHEELYQEEPAQGVVGRTLPLVLTTFVLLTLLVVSHAYQSYREDPSAGLLSLFLWHGALILLALVGPGVLLHQVRRQAWELAAVREERNLLLNQLRHQSFHDALTELPNRMLLEERLQHKIIDARRSGTRFMFMLVSLNDFKRINKMLGYEVGDQVLRQVARNMVEALRENDTVARFDGDVFAVAADISERSQAEIIARKVQDAVGRPIDMAESPVTVSAAIGVAIFPEQGNELSVLIEHADHAVTKARQAGGHTIIFSEEGATIGVDRLALVTGIKDAMIEGHLSMVYQPKLSLIAPDSHAFEGLLRWHHPEYGLLPADMYIPLVEQTRHIMDLTHWIIEACFSTQRELMEMGVDAVIAINLSARVLDESGFPLWVERMIAQYGLKPERVRFELTESAIMQDSERALQVLLQLAAIGVGLSVDDFGVGHSSLAYLSRLPVDELKVDKSFVINMIRWESDRAIVRATINLAHDLGLNVVAEGVENVEQATMLREMECDMLQGYYISRPLTKGQLLEWVASRAA